MKLTLTNDKQCLLILDSAVVYWWTMSLEGFTQYKRREFCKDVKCPVQTQLNALKGNLDEYERVRQTCRSSCKYTTWQFHHWLIEKGYFIIKPSKEKVWVLLLSKMFRKWNHPICGQGEEDLLTISKSNCVDKQCRKKKKGIVGFSLQIGYSLSFT